MGVTSHVKNPCMTPGDVRPHATDPFVECRVLMREPDTAVWPLVCCSSSPFRCVWSMITVKPDNCVSWLLHPGDMGPMMRGSWVAQGHARTLEPLSVTGSNRMAGPSNRGPCSASRPGWVHRAPYDDTGGHMLKIHGTAPHSRHTSPSSLRRGRGVLSLRARTVEKAPLPSTKVGSASGAGST